MNDDPQQFQAYRPLMFSIAYRMLGSATDAEDMIQEAYLRYQTTPPDQIESPKAFLSTIITRLCLNQLQSARVRRETYIGPWLPEPILTAGSEPATPPEQAELHESLSMAFLALLEQLTPMERAVFLLREVFDYPYADIAAIVGKEEAACRQMFSRARKHVADKRPRFETDPEAQRQIMGQFVQAVATGDLDGLMQLLTEDVVLVADGGGKAPGAALSPLRGRDAVARFALTTQRRVPDNARIDVVEVNGEQAIVVWADGKAFLVMFFTVEAGLVREVRAIGNPDKLTWVSRELNDDSEESRS
jgi:RNA polymerase sigma-70 factor (ECF subfamily)